MKPLYLIRHARNKARRWRISQAEIEEAIATPAATTPSVGNRVNCWHRWRGAWLRVTIEEQIDRMLVITVTPRRTGPEGHR